MVATQKCSDEYTKKACIAEGLVGREKFKVLSKKFDLTHWRKN